MNLAAAMARSGLAVGVVDADIYGHSVPRMLGVEGRPTQVEDMILPPVANDVKVISIGMFVANNQPVVWRGPMLHRALQQFLGDVYWGDLDVLLMDLPPGTGDIAISVAQLVPPAELLVVTTPQQAAAEVAERAGTIALQTHQQIAGVVENMSYLPCPHCDERIEIFGSGGGQAVADGLSRTMGAPVPLLGEIPFDTRLREGGDSGRPLVLDHPDSPASQALSKVADSLGHRARGLAGRSLGLSPAAAEPALRPLGRVLVVPRRGSRRGARRPFTRTAARCRLACRRRPGRRCPPGPAGACCSMPRGVSWFRLRSFISGPSSRVTSARASRAIRRTWRSILAASAA